VDVRLRAFSSFFQKKKRARSGNESLKMREKTTTE
jgi:hypothetical protein